MSFFYWKDDYNTGIDIMDEQHKKLVLLLDELYTSIQSGKGHQVLFDILIGLSEYSIDHFTTEEKLMREYGFKDIQKHSVEHQKLINDLNDFNNKYISGNTSLPVQLTDYLKDWLTNHILKTDMVLAEFLISKGVNKSVKTKE
ncbi:MAG: bacteriohemerythrin [Bacteroidales bacterium]|nr:bacteriohemerythrin [Bacteroidales bacterium]